MRSRNRSSVLLPFLALAIACDRSEHANLPQIVRDSAEITIIESFAPIWKRGDEWRVAGIIVDINAAKGAEYELSAATSSVRLPNGTIVVANVGANEIRWYDVDGVYLRTTRQRAEWVGRFGHDSVAAWDSRRGTMSVYDERGAFARSFEIQGAEPYRPQYVHMFEDRSGLWIAARDGDSADVHHFSDSGSIIASRQVIMAGLVAAPSGYYQATPRATELGYYDHSGALQTIIRLAARDSANSHARIGGMLVDLYGNLWVEEFHESRWNVFDTEHRLLGTVLMPARFTPHQIGSFVLGEFVDGDGVVHVRLYALSKPS